MTGNTSGPRRSRVRDLVAARPSCSAHSAAVGLPGAAKASIAVTCAIKTWVPAFAGTTDFLIRFAHKKI